jgi:hypothetical protein
MVDTPGQANVQGKRKATFQKNRTSGQKKRKTRGHMSIDDFCARLNQRSSTHATQRLLAAGVPPYNYLDISGSKLEFHRRPPILDNLELRLLGRAVSRIYANHHHGLGKEHVEHRPVSELQHVDLESCLKFVLFGERGVASGYHMDVLNGTYIMAVYGFKLWFVPSRPLSDQEAIEFGQEGST